MSNSLSLSDVVHKKIDPKIDKVESYIMHSMNSEGEFEPQNGESGKTIIVKRFDLIFNEIECLVFNFTDITAYQRLKNEKEKTKLLSTLNTSVHHEMIGPLEINLEMGQRLIKMMNKCEFPAKVREMVQTIIISSK